MWFRNPVSSSRFEVLQRQAQKHVRKWANRDWYEWSRRHPDASEHSQQQMRNQIEDRRAKRWHELQYKLQFLGDADPTPTGSYAKWVLNLLLKHNIDLPEDAGKLRELLEQYHRVKGKLPLEQRQIKVFNTYQHLRQTLAPLLPELRSRAELEREGTRLVADEIIDGAKYELYQLMTVEATTKAAKNTGWCVCNARTAENYLSSGPLYLVMRDGLRHALLHMDVDYSKTGPPLNLEPVYDEETVQAMNIHDVPLHHDNPKDFYKDVAHLLSLYLPQFLCRQHSKTFDLYPTRYQEAYLYNLECEECNSIGCSLSHTLCKDKECPTAICDSCKEDDGHTCVECHEVVCRDHYDQCCGNTWCKDHVHECNDCGGNMCPHCSNYVECCQESICNQCHKYCGECSESYCEFHAEFETCEKCKDEACQGCRSDWRTPSCCNSNYCKACFDSLDNCITCRDELCESHETACDVCYGVLCDHCIQGCEECHYSGYCETHAQGVDCVVCDSHTHEYNTCKTCEERGFVESAMCEGHEQRCRDCQAPLCPEHVNPCDCGPDSVGRVLQLIRGVQERRTPHAYCDECYPRNVCPVCKTTFCVPERHYPCAYQRKRKLRRYRRR